MKEVVVRFAPSPTGVLHIGSVRTALFNWLFARHNKGRFLLRIEDTDKQRSTKENTESIFSILKWLDIDFDGESVIQSSRLNRHRQVAEELVRNKKAYYCNCTSEELLLKKEKALKEGKSYKYDGTCRDKNLSYTEGSVIRLRSDLSGKTKVNDLVQGNVEVDNSQLDDLVLLRSDQTPTYMLSVVVDDHDMGITHVIRGDDHLTNTFRQIQIYKASGWNVPEFGHIPLIYGPDGAKLSKRHGAASAKDYLDLGFLPEAVVNYLLRLGWSHGDDEIISRENAISWFDLKNVGKSPSRFDMAKLLNLNGHYIRNRDDESLYESLVPFVKEKFEGVSEKSLENIKKGLKGLKERAKTLIELAESAHVYVSSPNDYDVKCEKYATELHLNLLLKVSDIIESGVITEEDLMNAVKKLSEEEGVKLVEIAQALRGSLSGKLVSPSVFEIMSVIGQEESVKRIKSYINKYRKEGL